MATNDFRLESALDPTESAAERDRILAESGPQMPAPPAQDHPMVTYARSILSRMVQSPDAVDRNRPVAPAGHSQMSSLPQGFAPQPAPFDLQQVIHTGQNVANALSQVPVLGGALDFAAGQIEQGALGGPQYQLQDALKRDDQQAASNVALNVVGGAVGNLENKAVRALSPALGGTLAQTAERLGAAPKAPLAPVVDNLGVNIAKIDAPQPVKDLIEQVAKDNAGFEAQRRGVVSVEETIADATKEQVNAARYAHLKPGTALNAEQLLSVKGAMVKSGEDVIGLQDKMRAIKAAGGFDRDIAVQLDLAIAEHAGLQQAFAGARAESGRALRIQREITGSLASGKGDAYDRAVFALGGKENQKALLDQLNNIWTDPALTTQLHREQATFKFIANLDRPKFFDRLDSYRYNAMLSGAPTQLKNAFGQLVFMAVDTIEKPVAAAFDAAITAGGKTRPRETYFTEAIAGPYGVAMGLGDGFRRAFAVLKDGQRTGALDQFKSEGIAKTEVNAGILNIATRGIGAVDEFFNAIGYSKGLYESAAKTAAKEGVGIRSGQFLDRMGELLSSPTTAMDDYATAMGDRAALRGKPGVVGQMVIKARDLPVLPEVIANKTGQFRPLRMVVPFVNTPLKVLDAGVSYSPLGLVKLVGSDPAARADVLARATLGSVGMGFIASQYAAGNITGAVPTDPAQRDAFYRSGKLPYSIKVNGNWVEYGSLDPISFPLRATARILDAISENPNQSWDVVAVKASFAVADAFKDATFLSGFASLIDALNDPEHFAAAFLGGIAKQFIPAAERNAVQSSDPFIRQPNDTWEQIESVLPGLNQNVAPRQTVYGTPAERPAGKQGIAGNVSPVNFNESTPDPVDEMLKTFSLPELMGPDGQPLPVAGLQVGFVAKDIASYRLNPAEAARYQQAAGQATHNLLEALFADQRQYNGQAFSTLTPVDQIRAIRSTIDDARTVGRSQVADEIVHAASDPATLSRGVDMRLSTLTRNRNRATYLEGLQAQGKLSGAVASYIDSHKSPTEPSVAEYVKAAPLVREYLAEPPWRIGNPQEWTALTSAKAEMSKFLKAHPAPNGYPELDWFQRANPELGSLVRRYSYEQVRNPKRVALYKQHPELSRFVDGITDAQQVAFTQP